MKATTFKQADQEPSNVARPTATSRATQKRSLLALIAGGACGLAGQSAQAIQLGEIQVQSALGQPLRASIAYALSANEQIHDYCIFLKPGVAAQGLPALRQARISLSGSRINITGSVPLREPMVAIGLTVDCPYTANLTRSYTLLLDPIPVTPAVATVDQPPSAPIVRNTTAVQTVAIRPASPADAPAPIALAGSYRVRVGDTLSGIATRIENRPVGLWQAVGAIFDANPDAFIDGDMNRLKAGSLLTLPSFDGRSIATVGDTTDSAATQPAADAAPTEGSTGTYNGADLTSSTTATEASAAEPAEPPAEAPTETVATETPSAITELPAAPTAAVDQTGDLRPGDVQISNDREFVSPIEPTDTAEESSPTIGETPAVSVDAEGQGNPQLLYWLGGTGLALFLGFVAFRSRSRFSGPQAPADVPVIDPATDTSADNTADVQTQAAPDIDFDIGVQADTQRQLVLDADLSQGTGLREGAEVEVAEDFGFTPEENAASGQLDLDVSDADDIAGATITGERPTTDMLPTHRFVEESILDREILPNDDEYDLSMIVDATKQEFSDGDVTAKDLMAIAVTQEMPELGSEGDEYTLSKEVDYKILEQDYEEELTATQALNPEIVKAATALANDLGESADDTAKIVRPEDSLAITAVQETEVGGDAYDDEDEETEILTDLDDTGINEALVEDTQEFTAEMPMRRSTDTQNERRPELSLDTSFEGTAELPARHAEVHDLAGETTSNSQLTEELPAAENDPTQEMDVESGRFRTKKLVG